MTCRVINLLAASPMMDSPPECVLSLSCEHSESPPTLPSLDHSPQNSSPPALLSLPDSPVVLPINSPEPSSQSTVDTPYFSLSPFTLHEENDSNHQDQDQDQDQDQEVEGLDGVPPSPMPAVALFPGGVGQDLGCNSGCLDSSPPATPSPPGFGALELALSSGQSGNCNDELDLQLFQKDTASRVTPREGGGVASSSPALRFPCHVCGKRFRFQSILSLHARAHSLDRDRRASALYRTRLPSSSLKEYAKTQSNHKDLTQSRKHSNQGFLPQTLIKHLTENVSVKEDGGLRAEQKPHFLLSTSTPPTPPLTEDTVICTPSPLYSSSSSSSSAAVASTFRCHACKGKFRTASELARHVRILHNPYKCTFCPFSANQEESLSSHMQEFHSSPDVPALPLDINSRSLHTSLDRPVPTPSNTPAPQLTPAPISSTSSTSSSSLPAFRCDTCGQRFTQSWFLKGHMRKHKDSLDHKCQVCGRGFKEPWFLKNHMKVHLNKLGLKAGLEGAAEQQHAAKGPARSQSLSTLYSNLLLVQRGASRSRLDREAGRTSVGSSKAALLGYLGLPNDGSGASCMERLQAVAQVAEMGGSGSCSGGVSSSGGTRTSRPGGTAESSTPVPEASDHATWWQLVARSLAGAQQQGQRSGSGRTSVTAEADQVRTYLGGLDRREDSGGPSGPWECPDCGKLFRSLQQVVVHARVHTQRPQEGAGREEEVVGGGRRGVNQERGGSAEVKQEALVSSGAQHPDVRHKPKVSSGETHLAGAAHSFHSVISSFKGLNGSAAATTSSIPPLGARERVRGRGIKDCPYCGKAFRSSHHLKVHLRVHTGERPYKCPHCDYAGTQSGSLKYHLQRHHREQRNTLAASANSSAAGLTSNINSLNSGSSGSSGPGKQRRSQLNHFPTNQGQAGIPNSLSNQRSWPMALQDPEEHQKALEAFRDVDLETQYRYLSGVMALYQGGMDGGWIRENLPQKAAKVSRRKPLTTSRMVLSSSFKERRSSSAQQGGFEPLDLSHRPSPGLGGMEEGGGISFVEVGGVDGSGDSSSAGIKLSQCLFCSFGTSSTELMAMHLQVNHTSKSRRKRGSLVTANDDVAPKVSKVKVDLTSDCNSAAVWKYVSDVEVEESQKECSSVKTKILNGLGEDAARHLKKAFDYPDLTMTSMSNNLRDSLEREVKMEEEEEQGEESEEVLGSSVLEN